MSRRSKETLAVQLFPFLAVLVCTMGSLIFLLLVTTRQIRQRAVAYAEFELTQKQLAAAEAKVASIPKIPLPEPEAKPIEPAIILPPQPEPKPTLIAVPDNSHLLALAERERELAQLTTKWKLRTTELAGDRSRLVAALLQRKVLVDASLERTSSLKSDVAKLETQLGRVTGEADATPFDATTEADRRLIEQQIAELKKKLRAAQAAQASHDNEKFQVVPFDPQTGTTRRPILIECTAEGIRFLPEDVSITATDLIGFTHRANPLAAGTGALINYWTEWNSKQRKPKSEPEPYVLLLVRPDGIAAYYVALGMLEPIHTEHGYELVDEATKLQLPEVDPGAKAACQAAVDRLLAEREKIYRAAVKSGSTNAVFGGSLRGMEASGVRGSATSGSSNLQKMANTRRSSGNSFTLNDIHANEDVVGSQGEISSNRGNGNDNSHGDDSWGTDSSNITASPLSQHGMAANGANESARDSASLADSTKQRLAQFDGENSPPQSQAAGQDTNRSSRSGSKTNSGRRQSGTSNGNSFDSLAAGNSFDSEPEPYMPVGPRPGKKSGNAKTGFGNPNDGQGSKPGNQDDSDAVVGGSAQPGDRTARQFLSDNNSSQQRDPNGSPLASSRTAGKPKKSQDKGEKQLEPEMLSGRRWGFSEPGANIGFEREVRVDVSNDKLVIADKYDVPIAQDDTKQEVFESFATSLDKYSREWGRPPQGFYWTPRLKFVVKPDGNNHYEQINAMMTRAGLPTSHEFAKDSRSVEFGREIPAMAKPAPKTASGQASGGVR